MHSTTTKGCLQLLDGYVKILQHLIKIKCVNLLLVDLLMLLMQQTILVNKGVPFRDAHGIIGQLVLYAIRSK